MTDNKYHLFDHVETACSDFSARYEPDFRCFTHQTPIWECLLDYHTEIHKLQYDKHVIQCQDSDCIEDEHLDFISGDKCRFCQTKDILV